MHSRVSRTTITYFTLSTYGRNGATRGAGAAVVVADDGDAGNGGSAMCDFHARMPVPLFFGLRTYAFNSIFVRVRPRPLVPSHGTTVVKLHASWPLITW